DDCEWKSVHRAQRREAAEMRIDGGVARERVERFRRRPDEVDLARQAFARADAARHPVGLDRLPGWVGKTFEDPVGGVTDRDRTVKVDENPNARVERSTPVIPQHRLPRPHASLLSLAVA